jgi:single-stranded-DNA-specific exonuclease
VSTPLPDALAAARAAFRAWLVARDPAERIVVFCHFDADGLGAGALFGRALPRLGFEDVTVVPSGRSENVFFSSEAKARLDALAPAALVVTDLGVHEAGVLDGVPTLYVDHHRPEGTPPGVVVSGYGWEPIPCSAWLAFDLLAAETDVDDLLWIAAVGVLSDLGEGAPWPRLAEAKRRYTAKWLKEAVVLTNAARRAARFDPETPLQLLMTGDGPRSLSEGPEGERLAAYRREVAAALAEARKAAPMFSTRPAEVPRALAPDDLRFALVRLHSPCQVHPLIAQQWRGRLPKYPVIAANTGYRPGLVSFSTRAARPDVRLPAIYGAVDLGPDLAGYDDDYGHGHDAASGGALPPAAFNRLLDRLGFPPEAHVPVGG